MSKNIVIQEGGLGKQLTADKLKTNLVGGGTCLWVPEDETMLGTKAITENGIYKASDDGYYGYSEVNVSGIGTATGTGPDGETHSYTEDGEGGVTDTVLPDSIAVVTPPTVTTYADGATIDFSGMTVKAYLKSGEVWSDAAHPNGIIPISELLLPVTKADSDESHSDEWSDGQGLNAILISYTLHWNIREQGEDQAVYLSQVLGEHNGLPTMFGGTARPAQFFMTRTSNGTYTWGATGRVGLNAYVDTGNEYNRYNRWTSTSDAVEVGEVTYHSNKYEWATAIPASTVVPKGDESMQPQGAYQTIPVQWIRTGDYKTLESSFNITVT